VSSAVTNFQWQSELQSVPPQWKTPSTQLAWPPPILRRAPFTDFTSANTGVPKNLAIPYYCESAADQLVMGTAPAWAVVVALTMLVTNAASESINAKIQWVKYTARGFRNKQNFIHAIYFRKAALRRLRDHAKITSQF
jgi:Transposase